MNEHKPGTLRTLSEAEVEAEFQRIIKRISDNKDLLSTPLVVKEIEVKVSRNLISAYKFFQRKFGVPKTIIYPCCDVDISPTRAFFKSDIVYIDNNPELVKLFKKRGLEFIWADATSYRLKKEGDLLLILNPTIRTEKLEHLVKDNGLIIANNYHGNVYQMFEKPEKYSFQGLIDDRNKRCIKLVDRDEADAIYKEYCDFLSVFRKNRSIKQT